MTTDRAQILQRALDDLGDARLRAAFNEGASRIPFEIEFRCPADDYGTVAVDHQVGLLLLTVLKFILDAEIAKQAGTTVAWLLDAKGPRPEFIAPTNQTAGATAIARMRTLVESGALARWQVSGDNASEISAALRLIPEVLAQLDEALAELRKVG
jgi:hypothetical protein